MKKKILLAFIMVISFVFSGCMGDSVTDTETSVDTTTENPEIYYEEACEAKDIVVQALNNKDLELFKSVLSNKTIEDTPHLEEEIQCTLDMYKGELVEIRENKITYEELNLNNIKVNAVFMYFDMVTTENQYLLDMLYITESGDVYDKSGIYFVVLADYDREYEYFTAATPYSFRINCGVFSSDLETMEFNEKVIAEFYKEEELEPIELGVMLDLNRVGIEKISDLEIIKVDEEGYVEYIVVDSINNRYYVYADEYGGTYLVRENNENGKIVLQGY